LTKIGSSELPLLGLYILLHFVFPFFASFATLTQYETNIMDHFAICADKFSTQYFIMNMMFWPMSFALELPFKFLIKHMCATSMGVVCYQTSSITIFALVVDENTI
jgi:hypothetical protein